ncbi:hypothetical protein TrVE_jg13218 [Triparma verrucosa]|uniref:Uncharacterized protein n=1 Tax=Triparma verrucosa TaxID=1606542 RepID=A0A9W7KX39_9STRA|nr:hypothetical protein TrVE_jg13218 [Triparma verrucosa]
MKASTLSIRSFIRSSIVIVIILAATILTALPAASLKSPIPNSHSLANSLLESTLESRLKFDHRAHKSRLVGTYKGTYKDDNEILIAIQPVAGGRHLQFYSGSSGSTLGHIGLTSSPGTSNLTGMLITSSKRGSGLSRTFVSIWLALAHAADSETSTSRIRKPLLALTLQNLNFAPILPGKGLIIAEVSPGPPNSSSVVLFSEDSSRLKSGFNPTEITSQRINFVDSPTFPRGKKVHLRAKYKPITAFDNHEIYDRIHIYDGNTAHDILFGRMNPIINEIK